MRYGWFTALLATAIVSSSCARVEAANILGLFRDCAIAQGGAIACAFAIGELPISARIKAYREFDSVDHMDGGFAHGAFATGHRSLCNGGGGRQGHQGQVPAT